MTWMSIVLMMVAGLLSEMDGLMSLCVVSDVLS